MDLIHTFLNLVAPPFTFLSLCFLMPPYLFYKAFTTIFYTIFKENVAGKVILITGASSGIGEHLAYEYAKNGAYLALVARREGRLREVAYIARELGSPDVMMILADVREAEDCRRIVEETMNYFGRMDHLVNNAGISSACMLEEATDINTFRPVMDTNFWGSAYTTSYAVPYLRETRGKIIVMSSSASWLPSPRMSIYNASKAALVSFFETLRIELSPDIHVLIVTPGFIESELTQGKLLTKEGIMDIDQDTRDLTANPPSQLPVHHRSYNSVTSLPSLHLIQRPNFNPETSPGRRTEKNQIGDINFTAPLAKSSLPVNNNQIEQEVNELNSTPGDKYLTEPSWFRITWLWKVLAPDVIEWMYRLFYLPGAEAPSKKILDRTDAHRYVYPEAIQIPELKKE